MPLPPATRKLLAPCRPKRAAHDSGPRRPDSLDLVVIHSTEGGTAAGVASFFSVPSTEASTQLVIDDKECWRCVPDLVIPWGAPGANRRGLHIEHCGFAKWSREEWLLHRPTLDRSAAKAARWCWLYGIPTRWLTIGQLRAGERGFTTHAHCSVAFPPNAGHTDPGGGFPKPLYMQLVRKYLAQLSADRRAPIQD